MTSLLSTADKVQGRLIQYFLSSESGEVKDAELGDHDLTLTVTQGLLYVKVLLQQVKKHIKVHSFMLVNNKDHFCFIFRLL